MHDSAMAFVRRSLSEAEVRGAAVLEVGSRDVNGSPRSVIQPMLPSSYIGIDAVDGSGVDIVCDASNLDRIAPSTGFDIVISTEMLEHAEDWKAVVSQMKSVIWKCGGILIVTTRSPGFPKHDFPGDYWRFTPQDFKRIFRDMEIIALESDPQAGHPGVFLKARKPENWVSADLSDLTVKGVT